MCAHKPSISWYNTPEAAQPGVYVYFGPEGEVLYIGKSSRDASIGSRLASHDRSKPRAQWREKAENGGSVFFIVTPDEVEAPSLEEYLIREMKPLGNKHGGPRPVPVQSTA